MTLLEHHILALTLTASTVFGLGLLVFLAEPKRRLNQIFGLYSLAICWWAATEALVLGAPDLAAAALYARIEWIGIFFIAPTFLHSVILLLGERTARTRLLIVLGYANGALFLFGHLVMQSIVTELRPVAYLPWFYRLTPFGALVPVAFFAFVNLALFKLGLAYRHAVDRRRLQLKYLFWASLIGYLGGSLDWCLIFDSYVPALNPFGIYCVPLYSVATTYAVFHHRLFDVHLVVRKSLIYSLLVTALTVGYFSFIYALEKVFQTAFGYQSVGFSLAAFAIMALAFQPLKVGIQSLVDWLFFRRPHEEMVRRMERLEEEIRRTEKLKAVSSLAAGLAHEIKNPLTSIKTFTDHLEERYEDPAFRAKFTRIVGGEIERINLIVQQLLEFAKPLPPKLQPVSVSRLLDETLALITNELVERRVSVSRRDAVTPPVLGDAQQLKQVFLNLFLNSLQAMNGAGRLEIDAASAGAELAVTISDNGAGIAPKDLSRIFEPFFTTKSEGTGLGLAVVHGIVTEHGGRISVESHPGRGTRVTLTLPLAA
jgi:signal transduction histidine kinase